MVVTPVSLFYITGLDEKIRQLKKDGVRITVYINPNLNSKGPLFQEAATKGYLVKNKTDQTYLFNFGEFFCGIVDLTNSDAYTWYKSKADLNRLKMKSNFHNKASSIICPKFCLNINPLWLFDNNNQHFVLDL
jgi:hypothetical protein